MHKVTKVLFVVSCWFERSNHLSFVIRHLDQTAIGDYEKISSSKNQESSIENEPNKPQNKVLNVPKVGGNNR